MTTSVATPALAQARLVEITRFWADEVAAGRYPYIEFDAETRWHQRVYRDTRVDVWLLSWLPTQATQLHDHGGSSGAFTVITGELTEAVLTGRRGIGSGERRALVDHVRPTGSSASFGPHYVHDVRNLGDRPARQRARLFRAAGLDDLLRPRRRRPAPW